MSPLHAAGPGLMSRQEMPPSDVDRLSQVLWFPDVEKGWVKQTFGLFIDNKTK